LIRIRIQHFRLKTDLDDQKLEKIYSWKKNKKTIWDIKTTIYLSLSLHKGHPSYRRSLQP
jgi:hypothetical protein